MSDNFNPAAFALQMVSDEDPFDWDWAGLQKEVDEAITDLDAIEAAGLPCDVTPGDLPSDSDWRNAQEAPDANAPCSNPVYGPGPGPAHEAELQSDSVIVHRYPRSMTQEFEGSESTSAEPVPDLVCDHPDCRRGLKPFKHKGDLTRHRKRHNDGPKMLCTAQECARSFTRRDKLFDHIRRGHDAEMLFGCSRKRCQLLFTKDLLTFHYSHDFDGFDAYRQCPMPKCGFRVRNSALNDLQQHLIEKHDAKGRKRFAVVLADRGYDYESANVLCPLCPEGTLFEDHIGFQSHFLICHCPHPNMLDNESLVRLSTGGPVDVAPGFSHRSYRRGTVSLDNYLRGCETTSDELREHRRTILSLCPDFKGHPVWDDIKGCQSWRPQWRRGG